MRAFVAVVPPQPAVAALRELVDELRPRSAALGWVAPERWHVTLAFLGEVTEAQVSRLDGQLRLAAAQRGPFELAVSGGGCFPNARRPRVFWAGLAGELPALADLARDVAAAARYTRIALDRKPFAPHVTLARVRRPPVDDADQLVERLSAATGEVWTVNEFRLMSSELGPRPRYETVGCYQLES